MKSNLGHIAQNEVFRKILIVLSIVFIIGTPFIASKSDSFIKAGPFGIFAYNMVASGLLLIPILSHKFNLALLILISAIGNIFNTSVNYFVGYSSNKLFSGNGIVTQLKTLVKKFGLIAVYFLAISPLPLDLGGLLSGYLGIPYKQFIVVNFLGKCTVFMLEGLGILYLPKLFHK